MLKSFLRYPGAKSSVPARQAIQRAFPSTYKEYREPFAGGASVLFSIHPKTSRWINDLNQPLIAVYQALKLRPLQFIASCKRISSDNPDVMREHFKRLLADDSADEALRFFLLNRCAFNGRVRLDSASRHRTYFSNPTGMNIVHGDRLSAAAKCLQDVKITSSDFEPLFDHPGEDVLVYADPPYVRDTELSPSSKLYEKGFSMEDHLRLKQCVDRCRHKVVLSYDDHPLIRRLYGGYNVTSVSWTYTGNPNRITGRELLISNFRPESAALRAA